MKTMTSTAAKLVSVCIARSKRKCSPNTQTVKEETMYKICSECGSKDHLTETMLHKWNRSFCNFKCLEKWQIKTLTERGILNGD